jgi:hypothetical protein
VRWWRCGDGDDGCGGGDGCDGEEEVLAMVVVVVGASSAHERASKKHEGRVQQRNVKGIPQFFRYTSAGIRFPLLLVTVFIVLTRFWSDSWLGALWDLLV